MYVLYNKQCYSIYSTSLEPKFPSCRTLKPIIKSMSMYLRFSSFTWLISLGVVQGLSQLLLHLYHLFVTQPLSYSFCRLGEDM